MKNTNVDPDGVENVAVGIIKQAKKDFIKGAKCLYAHMRDIPTQKDLLNNPEHKTLTNCLDVRWMYDAWRFVKKDPYDMFDVGEEQIIRAWSDEAILTYYKELYLKGAALLYHKRAAKMIQKLTDAEITNLIDDKSVADEFIEARNYISKQHNAKHLFHEYNILGYKKGRYIPKKPRGDRNFATKYNEEKAAKRQKNIKKAKELFDAGISPQGIAKEMGLHIVTIQSYLRS